MNIQVDKSMIGHNGGPSPFDELEALTIEARHWLDGSIVQSQAEADAIGHLVNMARSVSKKLDALRVEEKRPHDDAAKAVQEKFKPLLSRCDLVADACKKSLTPFLQKLDAEKRERERLAREEADRKREEAESAIRAAKQSDLEARESAEALLRDAKKAEAAAVRAENDTAKANTGGRAMSLRTSYRAELVDSTEAARHYWKVRKSDFDALLMQFARDDIGRGAREIPGFIVHEEKVAV
jgi:hypothetical protein